MYSTVKEVRKEAGFTDNPNITDEDITSKILEADIEIDGSCVQNYTVPFKTTPLLIKQISRTLAAGLLLSQEFGPMSETTGSVGDNKLKSARAQLTKIFNRSLVIIEGQTNDLSSTSMEGWPNNTTANISGGERKFKISDRF